MNPFHYGKIVFGSDFCPRAEEAQFREGFENNKIILLTGKPKIGKTSLVKHVISQYPQTNFLVHVDLKLIESLADVERRLVLALIESEVQTTPFKQVLIKYQKYNPSIKVDATNDDISFSVPTRTGVTSFAVIDLLRNFLKENNGKYPVLFLDNIQGLLSLEDKEFITMLSEYISSTRKIRYVLSESVDLFSETKKSLLTDFANENSLSVFLDPIPEDKYISFVKEKFAEQSIVLKEDVFPKIASTAGRVTGDRQHFMYSLWEIKGDSQTIDTVHVSKALKNIFDKYKEFFDVMFEELTPLQRKILKLLAEDKESKIYSRQFSDRVGPVANNTIIKVVQALVKRRIIYKEGPYYIFSSPFFREWINQNFNG